MGHIHQTVAPHSVFRLRSFPHASEVETVGMGNRPGRRDA